MQASKYCCHCCQYARQQGSEQRVTGLIDIVGLSAVGQCSDHPPPKGHCNGVVRRQAGVDIEGARHPERDSVHLSVHQTPKPAFNEERAVRRRGRLYTCLWRRGSRAAYTFLPTPTPAFNEEQEDGHCKPVCSTRPKPAFSAEEAEEQQKCDHLQPDNNP